MPNKTRPLTIDHGTILAHDMSGNPLHLVHEVSVQRSATTSARRLEREGFKYHHGWRDHDETLWNQYTRLEAI